MRLQYAGSFLLVFHLTSLSNAADLEVCEAQGREQASKVGLTMLKKKEPKLEAAQVRDILRFEEGPFQKTKKGEVLFIFDVGAGSKKGVCVEVKLNSDSCRVLSSGPGEC